MATIPLMSYDTLLSYAKNLYSAAAQGNEEKTNDSYDKFFSNANKSNPSVARMSLQQAQNDVYTHLVEDYMEGNIGAENFKAAQKNIYSTTFELNRSNGVIGLDKRVRELYPKTGSKRLAIITCLADGEELGLALCKNAKKMKKFQYLVRRLLKR